MHRRAFLCSSAAAIAASGSGLARAQTFPQRLITVVVASAAGGPGDTAARTIATRMSALLGQQIVVENIPGAGGMTGATRVARAEPDGHTLLLQQNGITILPALYPNLAFDVERDFRGVGLVNTSYSFLVGRKDLSPNGFADLIAWLKGPGRPFKFAHPGVGTIGHLHAVLFTRAYGLEADFIPYRGGGPAMNDIVAGHVDVVWAGSSTSASLLRAGNIKGYVYAAPTRYAAIPEIPSIAELGKPELALPFWHVLLAPSATPRPIIDKLNAGLRETLADPGVLKAYEDRGVEAFPPTQMSPEAADTLVRDELRLWQRVVRENNIHAGPAP